MSSLEPANAKRDKSPWNSLEATKVGVSLLTPIIAGILAFMLHSYIAGLNAEGIVHRALLERRLQVHTQIAIRLNRIFCFVQSVGTWKEDTPQTVIDYKRDIDSIMHANRALWSPKTMDAYLLYMDKTAFRTFTAPGLDAEIRRPQFAEQERLSFNTRVTGERDANHQKNYLSLVNLMALDLTRVSEPTTKGK